MQEYIEWLERKIEFCLEDKTLQREHWAFCQSLKKIREIEQNKWIKIESEGDLPKEDYVYWVMRKILNVPLYRQVELWSDEEKEYWMKNFSHYQKIKKPKPPIY